MRRRAELARALVNDPEVLVLDEPFRGLDAMTRGLMQEYCAQLLAERRRTILFITTDIDEAVFLADRLLVMGNRPTRVRALLESHFPPAAPATPPRPGGAGHEALELLHEEARRSSGLVPTRQEKLSMRRVLAASAFVVVSAPGCATRPTGAAASGRPRTLTVGYQPYYSESWSGLVLREKEFWREHLPEGSKVSFQVGLQGSVIVSQMLAGKQQIGYMGDMPAIVGASKRPQRDLRIVSTLAWPATSAPCSSCARTRPSSPTRRRP